MYESWRKIAELAAIGARYACARRRLRHGRLLRLRGRPRRLVAGADAAADRIASARERVPDGDFEVGSMEQLPWTDGAFDVVTGFNSFQYALDVPAALAEAARVSRGLLAVCKYGNPRENEFFAFLAALAPGRASTSRGCRSATTSTARSSASSPRERRLATAMTFDDDAALAAAVDAARRIDAAAGRTGGPTAATASRSRSSTGSSAV